MEWKHDLDLTGLDDDLNKSLGNSDLRSGDSYLRIGPRDIDDRVQMFGTIRLEIFSFRKSIQQKQ